jgi:tRNA (guanine37-N1)-methyltransferase
MASAALQVGTIENEYRVFAMEVLAGPPSLEAEVSQHGARFRLNFAEVREPAASG